MSSLFSHIFIPLMILLLFSEKLKLNSKEVFALSFFAVLPDTDSVFFYVQIKPCLASQGIISQCFHIIYSYSVIYFYEKQEERVWNNMFLPCVSSYS
jgi:hypothetical protein